MIFKLTSKRDPWLEKKYETAMFDLGKFFGINWVENRPSVLILPNRKTIDLYKKKQTQSWLVGFASGSNVFLLDRKNFETESNHKYSPRHYSALLLHELCHLYINILTKGFNNPKWLIEGICIYLSGQLEEYKKPEKINTFLESYGENGENLYRESGFAVEQLIQKFGKDKLLELLKKLADKPDVDEFKKLFMNHYGQALDYSLFQS